MKRPVVWKEGDWLRRRHKTAHTKEWAVVYSLVGDLVQLWAEGEYMPVVTSFQKAQAIYALARTAYRRTWACQLPDWMTVGTLVTAKYSLDKDLSVYRIVELRSQWVRIEREDQLFYITQAWKFKGSFTPHLNRFQRELDL